MPLDCEQLELLLADALGDELSNSDRRDFDAHLEICDACRLEYQSLMKTLNITRDRLSGTDAMTESPDRRPTIRIRRTSGWALVRYAAAIVIAFGAGYAMRAIRQAGNEPDVIATNVKVTPATIQERLVIAHQRAPHASSFAKSMLAVMGSAASDSRGLSASRSEGGE